MATAALLHAVGRRDVASAPISAFRLLRTAMGGNVAEEIKSKLVAANKAVSKIGQHMQGGSSRSASGDAEDGGDQASEAEYEEVKK